MLTNLESLLVFLDGRKAILSQLLSAFVVYLMATGVVDNLLGALLQTIILVLTGSAVIKTNNAVADMTIGNQLGVNLRNKRGL